MRRRKVGVWVRESTVKMNRGFNEALGYTFNRETNETVRFGRSDDESEEVKAGTMGWMDEVEEPSERVIRQKRPRPPKKTVQPAAVERPTVRCEAPEVGEALSWMDDCEEVIQVKRRKTEALKHARVQRDSDRITAARRDAALKKQAKDARRQIVLKKRAKDARRRAKAEQAASHAQRPSTRRKQSSRRTTVSLGWLDGIGSDERLIEPIRPTRAVRESARVRPEAEAKSTKKRAASTRTKRAASRRTERQPKTAVRRVRPVASEISLSPSEVQLLGQSPDEVFDGTAKKRKKKKRKASRRVSVRRESGRLKRAELQRRFMESSDLSQALDSGSGFAQSPTSFAPPPDRRERPFRDRPTPTKFDRLRLERELTESSCG